MARAVIELPTASEDVTVGFAFVDVTISEIRAVLRGTSTPSVTWTLRYDSDRSAAGTEVITGGTVTTSTSGQTITTFTNDTIPAGSYFWLETTAQSGTVQELAVSIFSAGLR
jgi:hypothetical protein